MVSEIDSIITVIDFMLSNISSKILVSEQQVIHVLFVVTVKYIVLY